LYGIIWLSYDVEIILNKCDKMVNSKLIIDKSKIYTETKRDLKVFSFDVLDSTNSYLKEQTDLDEALVVANMQTGGRGRMGRSFYSPEGAGVYMSLLVKPKIDLDNITLITPLVSVCVKEAVHDVTGLELGIKWVNDLFLNSKKVCGILTELDTRDSLRLIAGIGINCFENSFPEELKEICTYLENPLKPFTREDLIYAIVSKFFKRLEAFEKGDYSFMKDYREGSIIIGHEVMILNPAKDEKTGEVVRVLDIDEKGQLVVKFISGDIKYLSTGEISIKKLYY